MSEVFAGPPLRAALKPVSASLCNLDGISEYMRMDIVKPSIL